MARYRQFSLVSVALLLIGVTTLVSNLVARSAQAANLAQTPVAPQTGIPAPMPKADLTVVPSNCLVALPSEQQLDGRVVAQGSWLVPVMIVLSRNQNGSVSLVCGDARFEDRNNNRLVETRVPIWTAAEAQNFTNWMIGEVNRAINEAVTKGALKQPQVDAIVAQATSNATESVRSEIKTLKSEVELLKKRLDAVVPAPGRGRGGQ